MNLFILLSALGLSHSIFGERLLPIGTLYDPFIQRGLDALNYACYQDARFLLVATPSGVTLAPEGGAHQSIATPLIGMAQDGLAAFEPAFVDELAVIMRFALRLHAARRRRRAIRANLAARRDRRLGLSAPLDAAGGAAIARDMTPDLARGHHRWRLLAAASRGPMPRSSSPTPGAVAPEAIEAVGLMAEDRRDVGLLAVTSADRLNAGWTAAQPGARARPAACQEPCRAPARRPAAALRHRHRDRRPSRRHWPGSARCCGHRTRSLGVEHFGQTGTIADLYRHFGIDANSIATAGDRMASGRPVRYLRALD